MPSRRHLFPSVVLAVLVLAGITPALGSSRADGPTFEVGTVDVRAAWATVSLTGTFHDPVVVLGAPTYNGTDPVEARVRNVTPTSFEVRLAEWGYLDGSHALEQVSYLVMEAGIQEIAGRRWYAGHADAIDHTWTTVNPNLSGFKGGQTVLTTLVTERGTEPVTTRVKDIAGSAFKVRLEEEAANDGVHTRERVDYVMAPCCGSGLDTASYVAGSIDIADAAPITWGATMTAPRVFAQVSTVRDTDTVTLRLQQKSASSADLVLQEEASDGESQHVAESVRYVVLDAPAPGTAPAPSPTPTPSPTPSTCARPTNPVLIRPTDDLSARVANHPEGTEFLLTAGVHRAAQVSPKRNQKFYGQRDDQCRRLTTLSGAVTVGSWSRSDGLWVSRGHSQSVPPRSVPCEPDAPRCHHPQDLYRNGQPLAHVGSKSAVGPGSWYFDYGTRELWVGSDPTTANMELSVKPAAFMPSATGVTIDGLRMERYANQPQFGVIGRTRTPSGWVVKDNEIGWSHSLAAVIGAGSTFRDNVVVNQGGVGLKVIGNSSSVIGNEVKHSGWAGVVATWEGGGIKMSASGVRLERNCVHHNRGPGLWADEHADNATFARNVVFSNYTQGIFFEISTGASIIDNFVGHNGERDPWMYGGQIMISTSSDAVVTGNTVEVGREHGNGITIVWQDRRKGTSSVRNVVRNNDVTFLAARGVTGMRTDWSGGTGVYTQNTYSDNRYHTPSPGFAHFKGASGSMTLGQMKQSGQESGSTIDSSVNPISWSCGLRP